MLCRIWELELPYSLGIREQPAGIGIQLFRLGSPVLEEAEQAFGIDGIQLAGLRI